LTVWLTAGLASGLGTVPPLAAQSITFATPAFDVNWRRYDQPVQTGQASRSWTWGPTSIASRIEPYAEAPGGQRQVQYFDKARMELNDPNQPGGVTNGLLVRELVSGAIAVGDAAVQPSSPARQTVAGDPVASNPNGPTYLTFNGIASLNNDHRAPDRTGQRVDQSITQAGLVGTSTTGQLVYAFYEPTLGHNIPDVLWRFLTQSGPVYFPADGQTGTVERVYDPWQTVMGLPITEAYWTSTNLGGVPTPVLVQLYERRVLTYTPSNPAASQVEMGNVGQAYYAWRYHSPQPAPTPVPPPTPGATYLDDRSDPVQVIRSLYNAINRKEYARAYSYWQATDQVPPFDQFAQGYAQTQAVQLTTGAVVDDPGAGQLNYRVPAAIAATVTGGTTQYFAGCYRLHLTQPALQEQPPYQPLGITGAEIQPVADAAAAAARVAAGCP
jgi:hypothetical protein